jgi:hypothetical protein
MEAKGNLLIVISLEMMENGRKSKTATLQGNSSRKITFGRLEND